MARNDVISSWRLSSEPYNWLAERHSRKVLLRYQFHSYRSSNEACFVWVHACVGVCVRVLVCASDHSPLRHTEGAIRAASIIRRSRHYLLGYSLMVSPSVSLSRTHTHRNFTTAHAFRCASTQLMGGWEMGVVSWLLPSCCHGDADGAFPASRDPHFATYTHARRHTHFARKHSLLY